jgi:hypothetical protein
MRQAAQEPGNSLFINGVFLVVVIGTAVCLKIDYREEKERSAKFTESGRDYAINADIAQ